MYATLYSAIRPYWHGGRDIRDNRRQLERTQWLSPAELRDWQLERLRALVRHAYDNVPYLRRRYQAAGIQPEDITAFNDFEKLPFMTRDDLNEHLEELVPREWRGRVEPNSTGGSTGQPTRFYIDDSYHWWDWALELRGRSWYGARDGERLAWVWGAERDMPAGASRARLKAGITRQKYLNAFSMTEAKMAEFAALLVRWRPAMIRAYASALTLFAQFLVDHRVEGIRPKLIEVTAEKVTDGQRELLERTFGCPVVDWYTAREFGTIGFQCPAGSLHMCETRIVEVVANGRAAHAGQPGEVVITSLHQYGMPFIRYKLGDMAVRQSEPCACGRGLPVLKEIVGRTQDFLVTSTGEFVHGAYFPHTLREYPVIRRYQVRQPDCEHLELRLILAPEASLDCLEGLRSRLQHRFGAGMEISLQRVDTIELTRAGKHQPVVSSVRPSPGDAERAWTAATERGQESELVPRNEQSQ